MNVYDHIEPNLIEAKTSGMDQDIMLSIAISLKRIADKLELSQKQPIIMTAEEAEKVGYKFPPNEVWNKG